jgi:hypothetical protein
MLPGWAGTGTSVMPKCTDAAPATTRLQDLLALMERTQERLANAMTEAADLQVLLNDRKAEQLNLEQMLCRQLVQVAELQQLVQQQLVCDQHMAASSSEPTYQLTRDQMQEYLALRSSALASSERVLGQRLAAALAPTLPHAAATDPYDTDEDDEGDPHA